MADRLEQAALSGALTSGPSNEPDPDGREPVREGDDADDRDDDHGDDRAKGSSATARRAVGAPGMSASPSMSRGWSGNTGPKGVLQDYKASHGKSGAILGGGGGGSGGATNGFEQHMEKVSLSSGVATAAAAGGKKTKKKMSASSRSASSGSESEGDREARMQYRAQRLAELSRQRTDATALNVTVDHRGRKLFGHLREVGVQNFVQQIDAEKDDRTTAVIIHLYDPAVEACTILNSHLSTLARRHPHTKFLKGLAAELDYFSSDASGAPSTPQLSQISPRQGFSFPTLTPSPSRYSFSTIASSISSNTVGGTDPFGDDQQRRPSNPFSDGGAGRARRRATDSDVLPTLLWYRGGEFVQSVHAVERELPDGELKRGEEGCREVQELLASYGLISKSDSATAQNGQLHIPSRRGASASDSE